MNVVLAAVLAISLAQSASASLLIAGFYKFENKKPTTMTDDPAEVTVPGVSGWVTSPRQASQADNGSWDTTYGNGPSTLPNQPPLGYSVLGDGMGSIKTQGTVPPTGQPDYSVLAFWVMNTGSPLPLDRIYFDLATNPPGGSTNQTVLGKYWTGAFNSATPLALTWALGTAFGPAAGYGLGATTTQNDYNDYSAKLAGLILGTGETMAFMFTGYLANNPGNYQPSAIYVDNVGITAIPEPGSVLGLGCVLASGLMLRSRRKPQQVAL